MDQPFRNGASGPRSYCRFRCRDCGKQFNERSESLLNRTQYPSDVIALVVLWRLRYKLSLRDLPEMFLIRGIVFSHEAVRDWEAKLTPALAEGLRRGRRGRIGRVGMSTRLTSRCTGIGAICITPSTATARWST
jgi:putative transposase